MNPTLLKELIEFYPSASKYLGIYWDSQRSLPFWHTGRYDAPIDFDIFTNFINLVGLDNETHRSIERDDNWILVNLETGEASIVPWQEAETKLQQQFKNAPSLDLTIETNGRSIANRVLRSWRENSDLDL
jgi:hypothetical protein